ncbi:MAG: 50S ribosomal protein L29 [Candidatus Neomarinimicrobiota bacterium]
MKKAQLNELSVTELETKLADNQEALQNLQFQKALQQLEHPLQIRHLRREIAQIKTVLSEYQRGLRSQNKEEL